MNDATDTKSSGVSSDFDLDAWIDGTCGITTTAPIYQRGDLLPELQKLEAEIALTKKIPKDQRGLGDPTPDMLQERWDKLAKVWLDSKILVHIQDRTEERRRGIRDRLKKQGLDPDKLEDQDTIILHWIADAIIKVEHGAKVKDLSPDGFPVEKLRKLRDSLGDTGLVEVRDAFFKVISEAPTVSAPLSRNSSSGRGGIT